ncbi:alpha/beta hydrolase [Conexibacter stalactiti]|uniref:Alpha/beta hydrolase n=1 Tax=Conexibacter stalactiti TaxID=1940611 RepID=A0ABU4HL30_9ACTN|nr:alpha/beta hydrolase [Conexibacter stalactiti]MDW5594011.1 alpha/beta hydrolase [Conexibacter stalactiti]MEC5034653.1 alpha/beta hydrolase [Conexibacter stalactiti]
MPEIRLTAGTIEYEDSGEPGAAGGAAAGADGATADRPTVVLLHGLLMDSTVWRKVAPGLAERARVICPTLPLGGHRIPMEPGADLSLPAMARLVAEFLEALDLRDVVLVSNDWGGALLLVDLGCAERVGRLVITPSEAFDNFPPGIPGRLAALAGRAGPTGVKLALQPLRFRALRRFPLLFGWMSKHPVPHAVSDRWFAPVLGSREIRRDLAKYAGGPLDRAWTTAATERLREFDRPALVAWAPEDRLMPRDHGRRLAELLPQGRLVEIPGSYTLVSEDQPELLLRHLRDFLATTTAHADVAAA